MNSGETKEALLLLLREVSSSIYCRKSSYPGIAGGSTVLVYFFCLL